MQFEMTAADLQANPGVLSRLFAKQLAKVRWDAYDLTHLEIQWLLDNDKAIDYAVLYSPVKSQAVLDAFVPLTWPGQQEDEEGAIIRMTFGEYLRVTEVTGGFVMQYAGGPKVIATNAITLPIDSQLRIQIAMGGGFLTQAEVDLIKTVPPVE